MEITEMRHALPSPPRLRRLWPIGLLLACAGSGGSPGAGPGPQPTETAPFTDALDDFDTSRWEKADWANGAMFDCGWRPDHATFADGALTLTLDDVPSHGKAYTGAEYRTRGTYGHGTFEVRMKAAQGSGIVSSFFLYGESRDEIDVEILGKDTTQVQFNYFVKGVGNHEKVVDLGFDAAADFHTYAIAWGEDGIRWSVDGVEVWSAAGGSLPTDAMKVMMNLWPGTGVDAWLGAFRYSAPLHASYDQVRYSPP